MRTKGLRILTLFLCVFSFICCDKEHEEDRKATDYKEYVLTVASKKYREYWFLTAIILYQMYML